MKTDDILKMLMEERDALKKEYEDPIASAYNSGWYDAYDWIISTIEQQVCIEKISNEYQLKLFEVNISKDN